MKRTSSQVRGVALAAALLAVLVVAGVLALVTHNPVANTVPLLPPSGNAPDGPALPRPNQSAGGTGQAVANAPTDGMAALSDTADESDPVGDASSSSPTDGIDADAGSAGSSDRRQSGRAAWQDQWLAWDEQTPPYPEHIDELPPWRLTQVEAQRLRQAGRGVVWYPDPPGPWYDDEGDLRAIQSYNPTTGVRRTWYTWGDPRPDDIESFDALPSVDDLLGEFGVWMQREDGRYEVGFQAADGRFFKYAVGPMAPWGLRSFEDVPTGRDISQVGSQYLHAIGGTDLLRFGRVRGGYSLPGLFEADLPATPEAENTFVTFEGYPRIAMDHTWDWFGEWEVMFFKMWQRNPEVVTIPRLPEPDE